MTGTDYYAVYRQDTKKGPSRFVCHVEARDSKHALSIARSVGLTLPRFSVAVRIGKSGYFSALAKVFGHQNEQAA